jgi:catechol 2,3-dioxygenase-like lactoylglutathione lyase family enzyme
VEEVEEFYPMPLFVKLTVRDVRASAAWYESALGFRPVYALAGEGGRQTMSHLRRDRYQDLMLVAAPPGEEEASGGRGIVINLALDGDIDDLASRARSAGGPVDGPARTAWNTVELTISDPDGYVLTFSQVADATLTFDEVMPPDAGRPPAGGQGTQA